MHKVNNTIQRILWLIYVEIRYKLSEFGLMFLVCFAILVFYYWNPSFAPVSYTHLTLPTKA